MQRHHEKAKSMRNKLTVSLLSITILIFININFSACSKKKNNDIEKEKVISIMQETQSKMQAPGWMASVKTPTDHYEISGGKANLSTNSEMMTTDLLRIGSITKSFTATLILILCDEGAIKLDNKLDNYYPEFPNSDKFTVRQLLMHTSGIVSWDENDSIRNEIYNGNSNWTIDKLIGWASQQEFHFEPGTGFHYSNIGYFLLGKIIEQSSGSTVDLLMEEKICAPLNLKHTFMPVSPHPSGETIHGYDGSSGNVEDMTGTPQADAINFELAWTAGAMLSTLEDLSVWIRAISNGDLLSDSLHYEQMPILMPPTEQLPYWSGYGMGINQTGVWLSHNGAISGYICNMTYYPEEDASIVTFFNKFSAFDVDENTTDLNAFANNTLEIIKYLYPETLQTTN